MRKTKYLAFGVGVLTACVSSFMFSRPVQAAGDICANGGDDCVGVIGRNDC